MCLAYMKLLSSCLCFLHHNYSTIIYMVLLLQGGPRICLGKEFAYRQMKIFSAVLLGTFRFKLSDEERRVTYRTMLTLHIDGGLHLHASYRLRHHNPPARNNMPA
uniref:Putative ovule protein n=1 Tax=Solanum chacoense TaxID=4108 RepID=A0A0V0GMM1_SOLCH